MKQAVDQLFDELREIAQGNLSSPPDQGTDAADGTQAEGDIPVEFSLDENGKHEFRTRQYGAGVTILGSFAIHDPAVVYDVEVTSSTGGGGKWQGVGVSEYIDFELSTSFWTKTEIVVRISADAPNASCWGTLSYKF